MLKGAIHIHSTYSDGEFSLSALRQFFLAAGCQFVCLADHAEAFDADKLRAYEAECAGLSDGCFCLVPGLEYSCRDRFHILGYGMTSLIASRDPEEVIRALEAAGGFAIIAHPANELLGSIERFRALPAGLEVWNTKYDGRYAPRPAVFRLLARLQAHKPELLAFYGLDLHWRNQYRGLLTCLDASVLTREEILSALRQGRFSAEKGRLELPSSGRLPHDWLGRFAQRHERWGRLRSWMNGVRAATDRWGLPVPARLKSQLRRLL